MDDRRFDSMTRTFGARLRRRGVLRATIATLLAGAAIARVDEAGAVPPTPGPAPRRGTCRSLLASCTRGNQCCSGFCENSRQAPRSRRNRCSCPDGGSPCDGACVSVQTSMANCGQCGRACDDTRADSCLGGTCRCGEDDACTGTELCVSGTCQKPPECTGANSVGQTCTYASDCCSLTCVAGVCAEPATTCTGFTGAAFNPDYSICLDQKGRTSGTAFAFSQIRCGHIINAAISNCSDSSDCQVIADASPNPLLGVCIDASLGCDGTGTCNPGTGSGVCAFFYGPGAICP